MPGKHLLTIIRMNDSLKLDAVQLFSRISGDFAGTRVGKHHAPVLDKGNALTNVLDYQAIFFLGVAQGMPGRLKRLASFGQFCRPFDNPAFQLAIQIVQADFRLAPHRDICRHTVSVAGIHGAALRVHDAGAERPMRGFLENDAAIAAIEFPATG
jgi:hypothetical protein